MVVSHVCESLPATRGYDGAGEGKDFEIFNVGHRATF